MGHQAERNDDLSERNRLQIQIRPDSDIDTRAAFYKLNKLFKK